MQDYLENAFSIASSNVTEHFWSGVYIVTAIIMLIGIIKPFVFDKIKQKDLRRIALAGTDLVSSLLSTAIYFSVEAIEFDKYWIGSGAIFVLSIVMYWLYENTGLRTGLQKVISLIIKKIIKILATANSKNEVEDELKALSTEFKTNIKSEIKTAAQEQIDKEFEGL